MVSLARRNIPRESALVFDVGNESVGGALVATGAGAVPVILYARREQIPPARHADPRRLLAGATQALSLVAEHIVHRELPSSGGLRRVRDILCVLAPIWYVGRSRTLSWHADKPAAVTTQLLSRLLAEEERVFAREAVGSGGTGRSALLLERSIMRLRVNGYPTASPLGARATELELDMFLSMVLESVYRRAGAALSRVIGERTVRFSSRTLLTAATLRELSPNMHEFLFADIDGELTELALVKDGVIAETASFPLGRNGLLSALSGGAAGHPNVAFSTLRLVAEQQSAPDVSERVRQAFEKVKAEWLGLFRKTLARFSETSFLPRVVYILTAEPASASAFGAFIAESPAGQSMLTAEPFEVRVLNAEFFRGECEAAGTAQFDAILALECVFQSRFGAAFGHSVLAS